MKKIISFIYFQANSHIKNHNNKKKKKKKKQTQITLSQSKKKYIKNNVFS